MSLDIKSIINNIKSMSREELLPIIKQYIELIYTFNVSYNILPRLFSKQFVNTCYMNALLNLIGSCVSLHDKLKSNYDDYNWLGRYLTNLYTGSDLNVWRDENLIEQTINYLNPGVGYGTYSDFNLGMLETITKSLHLTQSELSYIDFETTNLEYNKYNIYKIYSGNATICDDYYETYMNKYVYSINSKYKVILAGYDIYPYPRHIDGYVLAGLILFKGEKAQIIGEQNGDSIYFNIQTINHGKIIFADNERHELYTNIDLYKPVEKYFIYVKSYYCFTLYHTYYDVTKYVDEDKCREYKQINEKQVFEIELDSAIKQELIGEYYLEDEYYSSVVPNYMTKPQDLGNDSRKYMLISSYIPEQLVGIGRYYPKSNRYTDYYGKELKGVFGNIDKELTYNEELGIYNLSSNSNICGENNKIQVMKVNNNLILSEDCSRVTVCKTENIAHHYIVYFPTHGVVIDSIYNNDGKNSKKTGIQPESILADYNIRALLYVRIGD